jgi:TolA-binding protein
MPKFPHGWNRNWTTDSNTSNCRNQSSRSSLLITTLLLLAALLIAGPQAAKAQFGAKTGSNGKAAEKDGEKEIDAATKELIAAHGMYQRAAKSNSQTLFKLAAESYNDFLTKYPAHAETTTARYAMAICHYRLKDYPTAATVLAQVIKAPKFSQKDEALAVLGHCYLSAKENEKALASFDKLLEDHPKSKYIEGAALNKAQVLYMLERKEEALKACESFISKFPKSPHRPNGLYTLAMAQHALQKFAEGETSLTDLLTNHANNRYSLDATLLLGQCQEGQSKFEAAATSYTKMIEIAPPNRQAEGRYRLAVVSHNLSKHDAAITQLTKILSDHKESPYIQPARLQLGKTQYDAGKLKDARTTLQAVSKDDQERADEAKYWIAQCDIADREYENASTILTALAAKKPALANLDEIRFFAAVCEMQLGKHADAGKAFAIFRENYKDSERTVEATYHQAFCAHKLSEYEQSAKLCEAVVAIENTPWAFSASKLWAENLFLAGEYEDAAAKFTDIQKTAKNKQDKLQVACRLGQCAYFASQFDKAVELLALVSAKKEVASHAELRRVIFLHGDALLQIKKPAEAVDPLTRYLAVNKDDVEASYKLGLAQLQSEKVDDSIATFGKVAKGDVKSQWVQRALFQFGQLTYTKKKDAKSAAPMLEKVVVAGAPEELAAPAMYLLAFINFDAGKYDDAGTAFAAMAAKYPEHLQAPDAAYQQGICLVESARADFAQGTDATIATAKTKMEQAITVFTSYTTKHAKAKHVSEAKHLIATSHAKLEQHDKAVMILAALASDKETKKDSILYDLAWSQRAIEKTDDAIETYQDLLASFTKSELLTQSRIELAELLYEKKEYQPATDLLEAALKDTEAQKETIAAGRFRLGWCYHHLVKPSNESATFAIFAKNNPTHEQAPSALYHAGMAYRTLGELDKAAAHFDLLVKSHTKDPLAETGLLRLGETYADGKQYPLSATAYQQFVDTHKESKFLFQAYFGIGWALEQQKKYEDARKWYVKTISKTNTETAARAQFQIGETWFQQGKFEQAAKELLKVDIVYDYPSWSAKALYEAGQSFEQLKQSPEAIAQYQRCVENYKDQAEAKLCQQRLTALKAAG